MKDSLDRWLMGVILAPYLLLVWLATWWAGLRGGDLWVVRGLLAFFGVVATVFAFKWWRSRKPPSPGPEPEAQDADAVPRIVDTLLRSAGLLPEHPLGWTAKHRKLPIVFLIGTHESGKTTTIKESGLTRELLAGDGESAASTRWANFWYSVNTIFVELGGKLLADSRAWNRLLQGLRPRRFERLRGKAPQSTTAALVCFPVGEIVKAGSSESVAGTAESLRERLRDISTSLGVTFPVYVLFTKMEEVSFFEEFARNVSDDEAKSQVVGVTVPPLPRDVPGAFADVEGHRLNGAMDDLFYCLCDHRPRILASERDEPSRAAVYEFPRELWKLKPLIVQFLVKLSEPSPRGATPFLRGFYFCGRHTAVPGPVVDDTWVSDPGLTRKPMSSRDSRTERGTPPGRERALGTTRMLFLRGVLSRVILVDQVAQGVSGSSQNVAAFRRILLIVTAGVFLLLGVCFGVSYFNNRVLESKALGLARDLEHDPDDLPKALERLEAVREFLERELAPIDQKRPLRYGWGLYTGDKVGSALKHAYYRRFCPLFLNPVSESLRHFLTQIPATPPDSPGPNEAFGTVHDVLKVYLMITSRPDKVDADFLPPVLASRWANTRAEGDSPRTELLRAQFRFYTEDLRGGNPCRTIVDSNAVRRTQQYLAHFAGTEPVYHLLLERARNLSPIDFRQQYPNATTILTRTPPAIPGVFTKAGWSFVEPLIRDPRKLVSAEEWVLGDSAPSIDYAQLEGDLQNRYRKNYADHWRSFLSSTSVSKINQQNATRLQALSTPVSPILQLLCMAARNTEMDPIKSSFLPVHTVEPAASCEHQPASNPDVAQYLTALGALIQAYQSGDQTAINDNWATAIRAASALKNTLDPASAVYWDVCRLLEVIGPPPKPDVKALNGDLDQFCAQFRPLLSKYPFSANAGAEASLSDIDSIFRPNQGALWTVLYRGSTRPQTAPGTRPLPLLSKYLVQDGGQYRRAHNPEGNPITSEFLNFFNKAAAISHALYGDGAASAHLAYYLTASPSNGIRRVELRIDGTSIDYHGQNVQPKLFTWPSTTGHQGVDLTVTFTSNRRVDSRYPGLWGLFRFFSKANPANPIQQGYRVDWTVTSGVVGDVESHQLWLYLSPRSAGQALIANPISSIGNCPSQVAR